MSKFEPIVLKDPERLDLPSASAMEIVVECPGQNNLKRKLPLEVVVPEEPDADEVLWRERGTRIHKAFETDSTLELDKEEFETYQTGLKYLESIKAKWITDKALDPAKVVEGPREVRIWLHSPYNYPGLLGSAVPDRHYIYRDNERCCLLVCDLKSGYNPNLPPSAKSWQLKYQLIALALEEYDGVTDGRVAYVKPKDKCEYGDFCDYGAMDIKYSWDSIVFHSWLSTQEDAPRRAGRHCRWCSCRADCPEALAFALLPSTIASGVLRGKDVTESVTEVTPDDLYRIWDAGSTIEAIIKAVKARLKSFPEEELAAMALRLGKGRETIEWVEIKKAVEFLIEKGWPESEIWACLDFGLGKLAKLAEKTMGVDEKYASKEVKELLQKFYVVKEGEKVLRKAR